MSRNNGKINVKTTVTRPDSSGMVQASKSISKKNQRMRSTQRTNVPIAKGYTTTSLGPKQVSGKDYLIVSHRELVGPVYIPVTGFDTFQVSSYSINPGLSTSFPWLSSTADSWDQYEIKHIRYEYVPSCPTTTRGQVMLIPEYDPTDPVPQTEADAMNNYGCVAIPAWNEGSVTLDYTALTTNGVRKFIRNDRKAGDLRTYDSGQLFLATTDFSVDSAGVNVGKLYVTYDIKLCVPQKKKQSSYNQPNQTAVLEAFGRNIIGTPDWRRIPIAIKYNNLRLLKSNTDGFFLPVGSYQLHYDCQLQYPIGTGISDFTSLACDIFKNDAPFENSEGKSEFSLNKQLDDTLTSQLVVLTGTYIFNVTSSADMYTFVTWNGSVVANSSDLNTYVRHAKVVITPA